MKILIIAEFFSPINNIASVRWSKFAKFLSLYEDFELHVICRVETEHLFDEILCKDTERIKHVTRIQEGVFISHVARFRKKLTKKIVSAKQSSSPSTSLNNKKAPKQSIKKGVINSLKIIASNIESYSYARQARKVLKNSENFDVVISSYSPKSSSLIGRWVKKKQPNSFWIADHRDPVFSHMFTPPLFKKLEKGFVQRICKHADVITAVSQGCLDNLYYDSHPRKVVLTNGFDRGDIKSIDYKNPSKFTFSYLGVLYKGKRDLGPLLKTLRGLIAEGLVDKEDLCLQYAGSSKNEFLNQVSLYDLPIQIKAYDQVPRKESLRMQLESHFLVLATWNNLGEEGMVSGKFLEYMMIDRPIIALVSGNLSNSVVKSMMQESNLGVCYEEATGGDDEELLRSYILTQYNNYKSNHKLDFKPNYDYIERYNYKNLSQQLIKLFPEKLQL